MENLQRAIGRMSVEFSQLEDYLTDLICVLLSQDKPTGQIVTCGMKFSAMCSLTKSLFHYKVNDEELKEFFTELIPQEEHCGEGRNAYIHSSWNTQEPLIPYIRSKSKIGKGGRYMYNWQAMGCGPINDLADLIKETATGIFEVLLHMQHKGLSDHFDLGMAMPEKFSRHFKRRENLTKPWAETICRETPMSG